MSTDIHIIPVDMMSLIGELDAMSETNGEE